MLHTPPSLRDRFVGCLLGHAVGDAFGAPFEGMPAEAVYREFGPVRNLIARPVVEVLHYTDDTEMTIGLAEALLAEGEVRGQCWVDAHRTCSCNMPSTGECRSACSNEP